MKIGSDSDINYLSGQASAISKRLDDLVDFNREITEEEFKKIKKYGRIIDKLYHLTNRIHRREI